MAQYGCISRIDERAVAHSALGKDSAGFGAGATDAALTACPAGSCTIVGTHKMVLKVCRIGLRAVSSASADTSLGGPENHLLTSTV